MPWEGTASTPADIHAWEEYCLQILSIRYGDELQRVPATRKGDLGIEAFARTGAAFQCHCPIDPLTVDERYKKSRDKLTVDLGKLHKNSADLEAILGPTTLARYVFMIPEWDDRRLLEHAEVKAAELRGLDLPILAADFSVVIHTSADYRAEGQQLVAQAIQPLVIRVDGEVQAEQVTTWKSAHSSLVDNLERKLDGLPLSDSDRTELRKRMLESYLRGQDFLGRLLDSHPELWKLVVDAQAAREATLRSSMLLASGPANTLLSDVFRDFSAELRQQVQALSHAQADIVALGTAADWLLRCPLEFPEAS